MKLLKKFFSDKSKAKCTESNDLFAKETNSRVLWAFEGKLQSCSTKEGSSFPYLCFTLSYQKNFSLTDEAHRFGINCRHFGRIRSKILETGSTQQPILLLILVDDKAQFKPAFLLVEIIARTCKNHLQEQWRMSMEEKRVASSEPYLNVAVDYLNDLLRDEVNRIPLMYSFLIDSIGLLDKSALTQISNTNWFQFGSFWGGTFSNLRFEILICITTR